jgi:hypothetical protein
LFKENKNELEFEIINLQRDLLLKARINDTIFCNLVSYSKVGGIEGNELRFYLREYRLSTRKILKSKYRLSLIKEYLDACKRGAISKYGSSSV